MSLSLRPVARSIALAFGGLAVAMAAPADAQQQPQKLDRIEVTGSNIKRIDAEGPQPVVSISRKELQESGKTSLTEVLTSLPISNSGTFTEALGSGNSFAPGTAAISLRGLGVNATLVLVNGRRIAGYGFAQNLSESFVDINSIPLTAIERIDILKDGASAIYGSDAIAGVVNVILRKDYTGLDVLGSYGTTQDGGGTEYRANVTGGWGNLGRDRYNVMAIVDYFKRDKIGAADRSYSKTANQESRGGFDFRSPTGNPGTWTIAGKRVPFASCPTSQIDGANRCLYDFAQDNWLIPKTERIGTFAKGQFDFTSNLSLFGELSYTKNTSNQSAAPTPGSFNVVGNPSNTVGATTAAYRLTDVGPRLNEVTSENWRGVAGLKGNAWNWDWEAAGTYSKNEARNVGTNYVDIRAANAAMTGKLPGSLAGVYYNLTDNSKNSPELLNAMKVVTNRVGDSSLTTFDAKATRELFELSGGTAGIALGAYYGKEELTDTPDPLSQAGFIVGSGGTSSKGDRTSKALFAELALPLFKGFESQLAVRYDDYSDFGSAVTPKIAASYRPIQQVMVRGGWGKGFRAPSLVELYLGQSISFPSVKDQQRCDAYTKTFGTGDPRTKTACTAEQVRSSFTGNPALDAEKSENYFFGLVFEPTPNATISTDYYNIKHTNRVTSPTASFILANENRFPAGTVNRQPQTANDVTAGSPGQLQGIGGDTGVGIKRSFFNSTSQETSGIDVEGRYSFNVGGVGRFTAGAWVTYVFSFKQELNPGTGLTELIDTYTYPRWRGTASLNWATGPWSTTVGLNTISSYEQYYGASAERVGSSTTTDLQVAYTGFKNWSLAVGGTNIFNIKPPFADEDWQGFDTSTYGPKGAFWYLRASYKFF